MVIHKVIQKEHIEKARATLKSGSNELKTEFKKQTATAIMAAFGLIIALAWKDVVTALVAKLNLTGGGTGLNSLTVTALVLTLVSVLGILLISKWAKSEEKK